MEWYKRYTNRSNHAQIYEAGFWGGVVFDALCDSSAAYDLNGRLPKTYGDIEYLRRQLRLSDADFCGECKPSRNVTDAKNHVVTHENHVVTVLFQALKRLISVGLVHEEDECYVIDGWERKQRKSAKTDAERARNYRENKRNRKQTETNNETEESVTKRHETSRDASRAVTPREEKKREEENRKDINSVADATSDTDSKENSPKERKNEESLKTSANAFQSAYNEILGDALPKWEKVSQKRNAALKTWLKERSIEDWRALLEKVKTRPFLMGRNDRGWRADALWLLKVENAIKVEEGGYSGTQVFNQQLTPAPKREHFISYHSPEAQAMYADVDPRTYAHEFSEEIQRKLGIKPNETRGQHDNDGSNKGDF